MTIFWIGLGTILTLQSIVSTKSKKDYCYFTPWNEEIKRIKRVTEMTSSCLFANSLIFSSPNRNFGDRLCAIPLLHFENRGSSFQSRLISFPLRAVTVMEAERSGGSASVDSGSAQSMKLLFVEMGVGYDQHGYVFSLLRLFFLHEIIEMTNRLHADKM